MIKGIHSRPGRKRKKSSLLIRTDLQAASEKEGGRYKGWLAPARMKKKDSRLRIAFYENYLNNGLCPFFE